MRKSWDVRPLGEIASVGAGSPAPQDKAAFAGGDLPFFRTSDVGQIRFGRISTSADKLNKKAASKLRPVPAGTILLPKSGASTFLNHRVLTEANGYASSHLATVSAVEGVTIPEYLLYFLSTVRAQDLIQDHKYPSLQLSIINQISVPLPPIEEQKRIAAILDEAFEGLARARENVEANLHSTQKLYQHFVSSRFAKPERSWKCGPLEQMAGPIYTGPFGSILHKSDYVSGGIPLINPAHIVAGRIVPDEEKAVSEETCERLRSYRLKTNDVVIGRRGEMGRCAVVTERENGWLCGTGSFFLRPLDGVSGAFVSVMLQSSYYRKRIEEIATGTTMLNLSNTALGSLSVSVPSYSKQLSLVSEFDEFRDECVRLADVATATAQKLDDLRQSLLHKAFSGQLT